MYSKYQILNVILADEHSKARKITTLSLLDITDEVKTQIELEILDGETKETVMARAEEDDRYHWIQKLGKAAGADLLTLGKVQPENMLAMFGLGINDFKEAVKVATKTARLLNDSTIDAEQELNDDLVPDILV